MGIEFKCEHCGRLAESDRPVEEALTEATEVFGEIPEGERMIVCGACYKKLMKHLAICQHLYDRRN